MSLSEIKDKLYKKKEDAHLSEHEKSEFDPTNKEANPAGIKIDSDDAWEERSALFGEKEKRAVKTGLIWLGVVLGIIGIIVAVYQIRKSSFNESKVALEISGPGEIRSGELAIYEIRYTNENWGSLKNAVVQINHPESFKPESSDVYVQESPTVSVVNIGEIDGHTSGKIIFRGKAYSPKGALIYIKSEFSYIPSNFNSTFSERKQVGTSITSTPIRMDVLAPTAVASGNALDYEITYRNEGAEDFEDIRIKADFPEGFSFSKAEPNPSEGNNLWYIGKLAAGESGKLVISGTLNGDRDAYKNIEVHLGTINQGQFVSYNDEKMATKIVDSPLTIWQSINGTTNPNINAGEIIRFRISYRNDGDLRLRNIIIREELDSPILDYATLYMEGGGAYNDSTKTIEWKASDHPQLALLTPGQGGYIDFSIMVKNIIPVKTAEDNNFVLSTLARIDSPDIPTPIGMNKIVASNRLDAKLNSKVILLMEGYYNSPIITNSGPIPPIVGQETSYTINLKLGNVSNKLADSRVEIVLPTGVLMTGKVFPENANLKYNERTNGLTWEIGDMNVGEGIISPFREVSFQVKIKPSLDQAGKAVDIVKSAIFYGKDLFTGEGLSFNAGKKNTMLIEDTSIAGNGWHVEK